MKTPWLASILGLLLTYGMAAAAERSLPPGVMVMDGRPAPPLRLTDMDGEPFDLSRSRGHWVFVHFWATWCGPCRLEMPTIQVMTEKMQSSELEIVLVNTAETEDEVFGFMGIVAPDLPTLMDTDGQVTEKWQPRGLPASFLVDPEGRIQYLALGGRAWDQAPYIRFLKSLSGQASEPTN